MLRIYSPGMFVQSVPLCAPLIVRTKSLQLDMHLVDGRVVYHFSVPTNAPTVSSTRHCSTACVGVKKRLKVFLLPPTHPFPVHESLDFFPGASV